jgi:hypothetical protein
MRIVLMPLEIVVRTIGDTENFSPSDRGEIVFDIRRGFAIEGKFGRLMIAETKVFSLRA